MTSCSKELRQAATQKHPLQITTRDLKGPDFKFELLPLHSPLLRQSLLVSFPPLIDMLKFSGYPYMIRGQDGERSLLDAGAAVDSPDAMCCGRVGRPGLPMSLGRVHARSAGQTPNTKQ